MSTSLPRGLKRGPYKCLKYVDKEDYTDKISYYKQQIMLVTKFRNFLGTEIPKN